ncbi:MAG: PEGA domain-containing protein, partial [Thermoanaerobaculia bacterium]
STRPPSSGGGGPTARDTRQYSPSGGGGGHGHHGGYYRPWYPGYWGGYWSPYRSWWWGGYWGPFWGPAWGSSWGWPGYAPSYRVVAPTSKIGALNLKLQPKKAAVYVDGYYVGKAKTFDGRPDFLWLEEGTYEITFYLEGYRTLTRTFAVRSGVVADVSIALEPGAATLPPEPTQVVAESSPQQKVDRRPAEVESERQVAGTGEEDWRQGASSSRDVRRDPGRIHLTVAPEDASVYLDGRFLGSGREIADLHAGLLVDPGNHLLEVVRPGFQPRELDFGVASGEDLDLEVALIVAGVR